MMEIGQIVVLLIGVCIGWFIPSIAKKIQEKKQAKKK